MFTGIITDVGTVQAARPGTAGLELRIATRFPALVLGESIAVDGACLTVQAAGEGWFEVHVIATSLERTAFASYAEGRRVNLERALAVGDRLGGHFVQGHVDAVGTVTATRRQEDAWLVHVRVPAAVMAVSVPLGSIAVQGTSLTINAIHPPDTIELSLIPFTLQHTTLGALVAGDAVHVEGDTIGKYVAAQLAAHLTHHAGQGQ